MRRRSIHDMDLGLLSKGMVHLGLHNEVALPMERIIEEPMERITEEALTLERITEADQTLQAQSRLSPLRNRSE